MPALTGVDWEAAKEHFVKHTGPQVTLREYAAMTPRLAWTGGQAISYQRVRDEAKKELWHKLRAQYLFEANPSLIQNVEIAYSLVVHQIIDNYEQLGALELARLTSEFRELHEMMMAQRPVDMDFDGSEQITRDEVLDISRSIETPDDEDLMLAALDAMDPESIEVADAEQVAG